MTELENDDGDRVAVERLHRRFDMKSLGQLVNSARITASSPPVVDDVAESRPPDVDEVEGEEQADPEETLVVVDLVESAPQENTHEDAFAERVVPAQTIDRGDGVDRSAFGDLVTRTGITSRLRPQIDPDSAASVATTTIATDVTGVAAPEMDALSRSQRNLARQILSEEIAPGGRVSDPRDVPGIVLGLARDLPAAAAVSVVRIDEEIEIVGNTIDPEFDPAMLASMFSGVFRTMQVAAKVFGDGPLGAVHDVVIEGEFMDLVLRPLGEHHFMMVLEDRSSPSANLSATRMRMAALAPGLSAILALED